MKNPLKNKRVEKGLTTKDMAEKLGISVHMVQSYENGSKSPTIKKLMTLANAYELSDEEIIQWIRAIMHRADEKKE